MSGTVTAGCAVSIPASVGKIIQDIKEIASNHLDEEIYAMLKECNMDPNETAQQLLSQDPFHDVKRKQDKRKEQNANTINSEHTRSRPSNQGRGGRGAGTGNYLRRYIAQSNSGPVLVQKLNSRLSGAVGTIKREVGTVGAERVAVEHATGYVNNKPAASSFSNHLRRTQAASIFSNNLQRTQSVMSHADMSHAVDSELKVSENEISGSTTLHSFSKERVASKSQTKEQPQVSTSAPAGYSMSRSSVMANNYMRPRNLIGSQKVVGPNKEWKSKPTNQNVVSNPLIIGTSTVSDSTSAVSRSPSPVAKSTLQDTPSKLQKISEELNVRVKQHVIIPNHLQLPEAELIGVSFGRFDANFMYQARL